MKNTPVKTILDSSFSLEDKAIQVSARLLTSQESLSILKHELKGHKPVEITISNTGSHFYEISRASTSLSCSSPEELAWKKTKKAIPRGIGFKVLGFIFWPFAIPSTFDTIHSFKSHRAIVKILTSKGFKNEAEQVLPYSLVKRILYIPDAHFVKTFTVALEDITADDLVVIPVQVTEKPKE